MPTIDVYNSEREKVSTLDLDEGIFGTEVKEHLLYAAVRWQRARAQAGTHKVKERAEVSGGGRKPWRQKGTGRARQGSIRSPQWRGGGIVHGPKVRSHEFKLNKRVRRAALCSALSRRVAEQALVVLQGLELPEIKTRQIADFMKRFEFGDLLLVLDAADEKVMRSARNLPKVKVLLADGLNVYDVLDHRNVVLTQGAVAAITDRLNVASSGGEA